MRDSGLWVTYCSTLVDTGSQAERCVLWQFQSVVCWSAVVVLVTILTRAGSVPGSDCCTGIAGVNSAGRMTMILSNDGDDSYDDDCDFKTNNNGDNADVLE